MKRLQKCILIIVIFLFSLNSFAQYGSLKVFSEIESIEVYLDDILQDNSKSSIDSVSAGTHYLKIEKNKVIIFSEIIEIKENQTVSVLLKNSPEIQKKLLSSKSEQIEIYEKDRLTITTVSTGNYNSSWYVSKSDKVLSNKQLSEITGDLDMVRKIESAARTQQIMTCIGVPFIITGAVIYVMAIVKAALDEPFYPGASTSFGQTVINILIGAIPLGAGVGLTVSGPVVRIDSEYAKKKVEEYNNNLKKSLGLPLDFQKIP